MKPLFNIIVILFLSVLTVNAQKKVEKASKSIDVAKDVTIDLNTSFVNIEFESWNKDVLEIEAYMESDKLSKEDLQKALKEWDLTIEGHGDNVSISTKGSSSSWAFLRNKSAVRASTRDSRSERAASKAFSAFLCNVISANENTMPWGSPSVRRQAVADT